MQTLQVNHCLSDDEANGYLKRFVDLSMVSHVVRDTTTVLKPDGKPLLIYIKNVLPRNLCVTAFDVFKKVDVWTGGLNRGNAAGMIEGETDDRVRAAAGGHKEGVTRYHPIKEDGTRSNTAIAAAVPSAITGYFDRYPRTPYCRQTAFTMDNPELWQASLPFTRKVSQVFEQYAPEQFGAQKAFVDHCHPDFIIPGTIFSTITVNRDWRTAGHTDEGDFKSGLGCMAVLQGGDYEGGELIFPKFGCAVDMRTGGVCLADVHEVHGNNPIAGVPGQFVRISLVFYCRTGIAECGSMAFELERAKRVGDDLSVRHATSTGKLF